MQKYIKVYNPALLQSNNDVIVRSIKSWCVLYSNLIFVYSMSCNTNMFLKKFGMSPNTVWLVLKTQEYPTIFLEKLKELSDWTTGEKVNRKKCIDSFGRDLRWPSVCTSLWQARTTWWTQRFGWPWTGLAGCGTSLQTGALQSSWPHWKWKKVWVWNAIFMFTYLQVSITGFFYRYWKNSRGK